MPRSAPSSVASLTRSSEPAAAITLAPTTYLASWMPVVPRLPPAPMTSTDSPGASSATLNNKFQAIGACRMTTAAARKSSPVGTATAAQEATQTSSAKPPGRLMPIMPSGPEYPAQSSGQGSSGITPAAATRAPTFQPLTFGPTASTTPAQSTPGMSGSTG